MLRIGTDIIRKSDGRLGIVNSDNGGPMIGVKWRLDGGRFDKLRRVPRGSVETLSSYQTRQERIQRAGPNLKRAYQFSEALDLPLTTVLRIMEE